MQTMVFANNLVKKDLTGSEIAPQRLSRPFEPMHASDSCRHRKHFSLNIEIELSGIYLFLKDLSP
jgi:hypothetical protein